MLPGLEMMMGCPNLAVPAEVMQHVVNVESSHNPFAIGVVGGQLARQPQNLGEALATVRMLEEKGYNFSVGLAQVNRANLGKFGLDSYEKAFDLCSNLAVGSRILSDCYASSGNDWGKAFSCYYSGNFVTGYRDGYVQKIYDSINRSIRVAGNANVAPIPLLSANALASGRGTRSLPATVSNDGAYRVALRSVALDTVASALVTPVVAAMAGGGNNAQGMAASMPSPQDIAALQGQQVTPPAAQQPGVAMTQPMMGGNAAQAMAMPANGNPEIFVPQVHGPNDPPADAAPAGMTSNANAMAGSAQAAAGAVRPGYDRADLRQGGHDDAFVF
ncbi:transglycosylase SLT domain-containing protein [Dyella sp. BiH032]|uniref:lytic transglycosylase domain-containing protein n=1 Tax=Dyella sp. BiH032 TaxID=3075430 RepID=UPI002892E949|nr:transglycosylase SLT domain-containing protein [Dyella sp. BiH032]WNL46995.1 transglycosylase SLT domain-containing protein [Dyella sp. BiH032]